MIDLNRHSIENAQIKDICGDILKEWFGCQKRIEYFCFEDDMILVAYSNYDSTDYFNIPVDVINGDWKSWVADFKQKLKEQAEARKIREEEFKIRQEREMFEKLREKYAN
jgi:hypothetical protein